MNFKSIILSSLTKSISVFELYPEHYPTEKIILFSLSLQSIDDVKGPTPQQDQRNNDGTKQTASYLSEVIKFSSIFNEDSRIEVPVSVHSIITINDPVASVIEKT